MFYNGEVQRATYLLSNHLCTYWVVAHSISSWEKNVKISHVIVDLSIPLQLVTFLLLRTHLAKDSEKPKKMQVGDLPRKAGITQLHTRPDQDPGQVKKEMWGELEEPQAPVLPCPTKWATTCLDPGAWEQRNMAAASAVRGPKPRREGNAGKRSPPWPSARSSWSLPAR